jgi:succinyl-CoA synthetase beta subunit
MQLMVAESFDISRETYFAILLDPTTRGPVAIASEMGGVDIEQVAVEYPDKIVHQSIDMKIGLTREQAERLALAMGFKEAELKEKAINEMIRLYKMFIEIDATQVEVNPFGETTDGRGM